VNPFRLRLSLPSLLSVTLLALLAVSAAGVMRAQAPTAMEAATEEAGPQEGSWKQRIEAALIAERFDDLDRMADQYRREKTRVKGGDWRLRQFYEILDAPQMTDKDSVDHIAHLEHWMQLRPESITARVALATSLHRWAWVARGNGLADTVTAEGWRLFDQRIKRSESVLQSAANLHQMCPQWYSEMMTVALAQSWDANKMNDLFLRGVQFEPEYFYLYKQYANYLLPKWDGKPGDAARFAKDSADRLGGDAGDQLYFRIATNLIRRGDGDFPVKQMDWQRIQHGAESIAQQYGSTRRMKNELAFMAYKYRDVAVARQQFAAIGDDWARAVWRDRQFFDRARDWSQGHNS